MDTERRMAVDDVNAVLALSSRSALAGPVEAPGRDGLDIDDKVLSTLPKLDLLDVCGDVVTTLEPLAVILEIER